MGRVYLAEDPMLDRLVAIKVIAIEKQPNQKTRDEYLQRFNLEARASAKLSHPSIVTIFDAGEQDGLPWIAFEYIDGDQLEERLKRPELLPLDTILSITLDISSALHHAHEYGIIHRDIKPGNILIDKRTHIAKLADFGVVKAPWVALTQDGSAVGSPGYMSPEQLDGTGTDERSDLFSFGIVLYQMLTGKHPFMRYSIPATIYATLHSNYEPVVSLRPDTPEYLQAIVIGLLRNDRLKRTQTAALLLHQLRSGSRKDHAGKNTPAFDKNAILGNTTRLHRISRTLCNLKQRGFSLITIRTLLSKVRLYRNTFTTYFSDFFSSLKGRTLTFNRVRILLSVTVISFLALSVIVLARLPRLSPQERTIIQKLHNKGYPKKTALLTDTCAALIADSNLTEAKSLAICLTSIGRTRTQAYLLLSCIALQTGNDSSVISSLTAAASDKKWPLLCKRSAALLCASSYGCLIKKRADSSLISNLATMVFTNLPDTVIKWTGDIAYWLRWNSVHIAEELFLPVDSVKVYILDLQHAGSVRTRKRAATRLGELGDKRAVKPLQKTAALGFRDPIVSHTAKLVLENYFSEKEE